MSPLRNTPRTLAATLMAVGVLACSGGGGDEGGGGAYSISGRVTTSGGAAAAGVSLAIPGVASTVSDGSGNYSFGGLGNGSYAITPSKSNYEFTPASVTVTVSGADVAGQNFTMSSGRWGFLVWGHDSWK